MKKYVVCLDSRKWEWVHVGGVYELIDDSQLNRGYIMIKVNDGSPVRRYDYPSKFFMEISENIIKSKWFKLVTM